MKASRHNVIQVMYQKPASMKILHAAPTSPGDGVLSGNAVLAVLTEVMNFFGGICGKGLVA